MFTIPARAADTPPVMNNGPFVAYAIVIAQMPSWREGTVMSAERGWIGDPHPPVEWRDSHYSRTLPKLTEEVRAEQEGKNGVMARQ